MTGWTKTPNEIYTAVPHMCEAELKLTLALVRETYGRHRVATGKLTYEDMGELTGLGRGSIYKAIPLIEARGFFKRGRASTWLVAENDEENSTESELFEDEEVQNLNPDSTESEPEIVQNLNQNSTESELSERSKEIKKKEREKERPPVYASGAGSDYQDQLAEMTAALASVTRIDIVLNKAELEGEAVNYVRAGYTAEQVKVAFGPGGYWYRASHGAKNNRPPYLGNIKTEIQQAIEWRPSMNGKGHEAVIYDV